MAAKTVSVSSDDVTYSLLPGGGGEFTREGQVIDDTILGQLYKSGFTGPINWGVNSDAIFKGYPGYGAKILKPGTSTAMTDEACALVSGKTYQITATARRLIDRAVAVTVEDNNVDRTSEVESIDFLLGLITFKSSYTVVGAVTITGNYIPLVTLGKPTAFTLNMTGEPINNSDMPTLQSNGGWSTFTPGLKSVSLDIPLVYASADDWDQVLADRDEYVIEINPDGLGWSGSFGRGFFRLTSDNQSGDVGALEEETIHFELNVPIQNSGPVLATPFSWHHASGSPIPTAIKTALTRFLADQNLYVRYLHDGVSGWKGQGVITNMTLAGGLETPNTFTISVQGSGAPTTV